MFNKKRFNEKVQMKKTLKVHEEKQSKTKSDENVQEGAVPAYLLDREKQNNAKVLSNMIKQKRKEKAVSFILLSYYYYYKYLFQLNIYKGKMGGPIAKS